ncbi:shk1 kinase-binding protein 1 [Coprinopsis cinerea okayama7|uniref:Protein arginine N-methyltransferase n=1 Tax=Coprinopsis cinerea (strain Okayama-7 / 130 / ATCC MYA-4618 / FGSC 9003) TaxID=240176 RepID=D6RM24_COPC7|nr:shk1 kinase-binding protein 1 [Coprinopsis cinerea okayama7\|eukprot:XP_002911416.1 shk1 kinase-binding protein 1 [Coprinopsis cinerea okayama7\
MSRWDLSATLATCLTLEDVSDAERKPDLNYETPVLQVTSKARENKYEVVCLPLTTEAWKRRWSSMCLLPVDATEEEKGEASKAAELWRVRPGFLKDEVTLSRLDEAEGVIAMVSEWLELDSPDDWIRNDAEIALQQELSYASYLNIATAILPPPRNRDHVASYARAINSCLQATSYISLSVRLPIYNPSVFQPTSPLSSYPSSSSHNSLMSPQTPALVVSDANQDRPQNSETSLNATWEMWDLIRSMCDYNPRLTLTLDLSPALPTSLGVLSKWAAEAVRHIFLPASTFIANMKGYPHRPTIILADVNSGRHARGGERAYSQYIRHLEKTSPTVQAAQKPGTVENFAQGYQDYLQAPLQPLMDNLPSFTYQVFEKDPVKYAQYEEAMYRAFLDRPADGKTLVCVAGAGRGPLVARCLTALERAHRDAKVYVIEKNPNAYVTLQHRQEREWGDKVQLVFGDMRVIDVPEQVDILVSELLGSFGDNELSPECLDGAMRFLKPDGISIPSSYTAHLAPLSSSKLYNEARSGNSEKSLETPYVVMFQAVNILSGLPLSNNHNVRSAKLRFYIPHAGVLHGLAGYFEAVLYGNVGLSIHPQRKDQISKDMLSWFPLFFPFKEPLYLPSDSELQVSIWRLTNNQKVWYEWHAESFLSIPKKPAEGDDAFQPARAPTPSIPTSPSGFPSPLIDSVDPFSNQWRRMSVATNSTSSSADVEYESVKIGHTSLHNPGGRSSWIGL